jgi:4-aminobutyrate aminotransferase-like enzyme
MIATGRAPCNKNKRMISQHNMSSESQSLVTSARFKNAKKDILGAIADASAIVRKIRGPREGASVRETYQRAVQDFGKQRGRDLYFPFIGSGLGAGPYVELLDGSVKLDMITGIGINFFGHSHPALMAEMVDALSADIMQGNLEPGGEAPVLLSAILSRVGPECRIQHGWLTSCGTMANEIALKIIRQKRQPATKILAFRDCFAGRSTAMQEITDNPAYRQGQPTYGEVEYLPFYDPKDPQSTEKTLATMKEHLAAHSGKFAALMMELVQGEGGFNSAPFEFYTRIFDEAKKAGLAIWLDEVQTFGRTGELFAFQKFGLHKYVDVVTVGKMLQACAVFFTDEYNPKPGLVAGTFSGSTVALRTARRTIELLEEGKFLGKDGKIALLSARFESNLKRLAEGECRGKISEVRAIGGMVAFAPLSGTMEDIKPVLMKLFDLGVVAFYCGHGPYLIRMLPPLGAMEEADVDLVCSIIQQALLEVKK